MVCLGTANEDTCLARACCWLGDGVGWYNEYEDYHWEDDSSTGVTSHYTQMVSSNVYAIGQWCSSINTPTLMGGVNCSV